MFIKLIQLNYVHVYHIIGHRIGTGGILAGTNQIRGSTIHDGTHAAHPHRQLSSGLTFFFAVAVGVIVIDLFAAQPLTGPVSAALNLPAALAGLVAMTPQLGYAAGLVLLVPLSDLVENRRLIVVTLAACAGLLVALACAANGPLFFTLAALAGAASSAIQMLVPMAAMMVGEQHRGRTVGNVMSGLMIGILLARPVASLAAGWWGWRSFYAGLGVMDMALALALLRWLPRRVPAPGIGYVALVISLGRLLKREPVLRSRALTAALCMAAFSAFWTAVGLRLAQAPFGMGSAGLALFAAVGVAGAIVAPLAGRAGDRGWTKVGTRVAHIVTLAGTILAGIGGAGWFGWSEGGHPMVSLVLLGAAAIAIDAGTTADQTFGRRAINLLDPAARGRLNGLFVALFFVGGAFGAIAAGVAWATAGWGAVCLFGALMSATALMVARNPARI
jgi:predicted MFS family arabinose efflux permease